MAVLRRALCAALLLPAVVGTAEHPEHPAEEDLLPSPWAEDEGCTEGAEVCAALSLRQLRAAAVKRHIAEEVVLANTSSTLPGEEEDDDANGLPGGWGEAEMAAKQQLGSAPQSQKSPGLHTQWMRQRQLPEGYRHGEVLTLYHATSPEAGESILAQGFKPGRTGWCSGAIYMALEPSATRTKASGVDSRQGFLLQVKVDVGRVAHLQRYCDMTMNGTKLKILGYDSIRFNPGDGDEVVIYDSKRILALRQYLGKY